jgi:hypothetical protein
MKAVEMKSESACFWVLARLAGLQSPLLAKTGFAASAGAPRGIIRERVKLSSLGVDRIQLFRAGDHVSPIRRTGIPYFRPAMRCGVRQSEESGAIAGQRRSSIGSWEVAVALPCLRLVKMDDPSQPLRLQPDALIPTTFDPILQDQNRPQNRHRARKRLREVVKQHGAPRLFWKD